MRSTQSTSQLCVFCRLYFQKFINFFNHAINDLFRIRPLCISPVVNIIVIVIIIKYHYHHYNVQFLAIFCALFCSCFLNSKTTLKIT